MSNEPVHQEKLTRKNRIMDLMSTLKLPTASKARAAATPSVPETKRRRKKPAQPEKYQRKGQSVRDAEKSLQKVDGRSLRATGRTAQLNIKIKPELKDKLNSHVDGLPENMAELMERLITAEISKQ